MTSNNHRFFMMIMVLMLLCAVSIRTEAINLKFDIETRHHFTVEEDTVLLEVSYRLPYSAKILGDVFTCTLKAPQGVRIEGNFAWTEKFVPIKWHRRLITLKLIGEVRGPVIFEVLAPTSGGMLRGRENIDIEDEIKEYLRDEAIKNTSINNRSIDNELVNDALIKEKSEVSEKNNDSIDTNTEISIKDILENPFKFQRKRISLVVRPGSGPFRVKSGPMHTRSDGPVYDETGSIWMIRRGNNPMRKKEFMVKGMIMISDEGVPFLIPVIDEK